jgi:cyclopropane-fatty-acyl-phospholipid synthase
MTLAARLVMKALEGLAAGRLTVGLPDGSTRRFGTAPSPAAELRVKDWRFFRRVLVNGDIGFAEAYTDGSWETPDLPGLIALLADNEQALGRLACSSLISNLVLRLMHRLRDNSRRGSRRNIHAHYDLGNAFYELWLDRSMTYSAGLYADDPQRALEAAQLAKYERVLEQIDARQGDSVLEIGCGWGGFAEIAARRGLCVTAITISRQQLEFARARLQQAGLADRVELQLRDYRDVKGHYDHVVSIEMVEAVGERYWPDYFAALRRHLTPRGSAVVQAIVIADGLFDAYRARPDFIQSHVFPGGMLLSPGLLREQCRAAGLRIAGLYSFGLDYARTLETWLDRFDRAIGQVARLGFDEQFCRMWRYYLAYCAAGFTTRRTDVLQAHLRPI